MATPWRDYVVNTLGRPRRWLRCHAASGVMSDEGYRATHFADAKNSTGASGTGITYQQPGPLQVDTTSYSIAFTNAHVQRGLWDSVDDFGTLSVFGTFHVWFKSTSANAVQFIWGTHPTGAGQQFAVYMLSGQIAFDVNVAGVATRWTLPASYNDGAWHLLGVECSGTADNRIYIDGVDLTPTPVDTGGGLTARCFLQTLNTPSGWTWALGRDHRSGGSNPFIGSLSEAMTWDKVLTAEQHRLLYTLAFPEVLTESSNIRRYRTGRSINPAIVV